MYSTYDLVPGIFCWHTVVYQYVPHLLLSSTTIKYYMYYHIVALEYR